VRAEEELGVTRAVCSRKNVLTAASVPCVVACPDAPEPGKRQRASAAELKQRLLRNVDANCAQQRAQPRQAAAPLAAPPLSCARAPAIRRADPHAPPPPPLAPRAVPAGVFYPHAADDAGAEGEAPRGGGAAADAHRKLLQRVRVAAAPGAPPPMLDFPTQAEAFAAGDAQAAAGAEEAAAAAPGSGERVAFFSLEDESTGRRRFAAASPSHFWRHYVAAWDEERCHHYELLREGRACRLYFDLEFDRAANPGVDGGAATDALLSLLRDALPRHLPALGGRSFEPDAVVELDSTTDAKFSRHLIIHLTGGAAFASAVAAGAFVRAWWAADVAPRRGDDPRAAALFVRKRAPADAATAGAESESEALTMPFVDMGVYTRNRAFRLYLSRKAGKPAVLLPTARCWNALRRGPLGRESAADDADAADDDDALLRKPARWLFFASLICNVPPGAPLLGAVAGPEPPLRSAADARAGARRAQQHPDGDGITGSAAGGAACPWPACAAAVLALAPGGIVRSWAAFPSRGCVALSLARNRYCGRIGRPHRSNGVFYVVDFRAGAAFQKCYDPECAGFRGEPFALPPDARREARLLEAMLPQQQQQQQQQPAWEAEDAWLATLSGAELEALDAAGGGASRPDASNGDAGLGDGAEAVDGWWAQLRDEEWEALDAAAAAAAART
jgi:hypothetical protein